MKDDSKWNPFAVPSQIENAAELEKILADIRPITVLTKKSFIEKMFVPILLTIAALFFSTFYVTNQAVSIACGIVMLIILEGSFVEELNQECGSKDKESWLFFAYYCRGDCLSALHKDCRRNLTILQSYESRSTF